MSAPIPIRRRTPAEQIVYAWGRLSPQVECLLHGQMPLSPGETMGLIVALDRAVDELAIELMSR